MLFRNVSARDSQSALQSTTAVALSVIAECHHSAEARAVAFGVDGDSVSIGEALRECVAEV